MTWENRRKKKLCSGEQEAAERVGKIKITISQRAEILRRRPKASTKLVHICSTSKLPNCTLMWEGPSRPQQAFQRSLSIKKSLQCLHPRLQSLAGWRPSRLATLTREELSYPTLPGYLKSQVNVFLIFCLLQLSPPLWLLFDLLSALGPWGKREGILCVWGRRDGESQLHSDLFIFIREKSTALSG